MIRADIKRRERAIAKVSVIGIVSNGFLGVVKIVVGIATHSVAIISDAVNNLTDTSSSIITIIGTHMAMRHPDRKHPFGYGRIEYLTSLVIGLLVLFTGVELCRSSVEAILHPKPVDFTVLSAIILAITVAVKIFLGQYTYKAGKKLDSGALVASGMDARSDAVATSAALLAVLLYLWHRIDIDAWVGALISLYIVRTGFIILKDTVSKLVGEAASAQLVANIRDRVKQVPIIKAAYDLILNNYGPDYYVGSINVEVDYTLTAEEISRALHPAQIDIYRNCHALLVFGIYAVDSQSPQTAEVATLMQQYLQQDAHCQSFHGLYVDERTHEIYCDIIVDYGADHDAEREALIKYLEQKLPGYKPIVTVDYPFE